ncbi:hypothetical protein EYY60_20695 [Flavobacterium zhairuonense]|uniref:hypothetical protein n=1 Tax=Flavobacterium zhairuonense TaxID=2493631 RepID=UPI001044D253|nr:hypothetical protein [Flavobacterium zhairuonense]KAF2506935.1 hypothetical protein EYY60_20695 [Flavobacterium zhairuonense]
MLLKAFKEYCVNKKKRNEKGLKIGYYILFILIMAPLMAYNIFMTTEIFVPEQVELANPKDLFSAVISEISKFEEKSDTIYISKYTAYAICNVGVPIKTPYEQKIEQIEERKKPILDIDKSMDNLYFINNKVIITGRTGVNNPFICNIAKYSFDNKDKKLFHLQYKIINKNKVEVYVYTNIQQQIWNFILTRKKDKWDIKVVK